MTGAGRWVRRGALLVLPVAAMAPVLGSVQHAAAVDCAFYYAYGAADGVYTSLYGKNSFPLTDSIDSEGPAAHALVNSGASSGVAGAPYPGDFAYTAPGLGGVDPSAYPLTAKSNYPTKTHAEAGQGPVSLKADSAEMSSKSDAFVGGGSPGGTGANVGSSESQSAAGCGTAGITADAVSDSDVVNVAGTLRIGRIHSEAHAVLGSDGKVKLTDKLELGQVTVAGQTVEITAKGLSAGGQTIPLPNPLGAVLKSQGIVFSYVAPVKDPDGKGVTAPGVTVSMPLPLNQIPVSPVGDSPTTATLTFGRAYAGVNGGFTAGGSSSGSGGGSSTGGGGSSTPPVSGSPSSGGGGGGGGSVALPPATTGGTSTSPGSTPVVAAPGPQQVQPQAFGVTLPQIDWELVYLAIIIGAFAVVGGGLLVRHLAERLRWT
jgi:hypothetical protein